MHSQARRREVISTRHADSLSLQMTPFSLVVSAFVFLSHRLFLLFPFLLRACHQTLTTLHETAHQDVTDELQAGGDASGSADSSVPLFVVDAVGDAVTRSALQADQQPTDDQVRVRLDGVMRSSLESTDVGLL